MYEPWLWSSVGLHKETYHVSIVRRAGTLLSDTHTEAGQAAIFIFLAKMKGSRLTSGARHTFNIHL